MRSDPEAFTDKVLAASRALIPLASRSIATVDTTVTWLLDRVTAIRRRQLAAIIAQVPAEQRRPLVDALAGFRDAAPPDIPRPTVEW